MERKEEGGGPTPRLCVAHYSSMSHLKFAFDQRQWLQRLLGVTVTPYEADFDLENDGLRQKIRSIVGLTRLGKKWT